MERKEDAVRLIQKKLDGKTFMTYKDIAGVTGYHPKYILKLKKEILDGTIRIQHGNTNRIPANAISTKEREYIISLYKRSNASVKRFCDFYGKRSYSCIYGILKKAGLLKTHN